MLKDCIMGAFDTYNWDQVKYWVNSINKSGFTGDKVVVVFNSSFETVDKLIEAGCMVVACEKGENGYTHKSTMPIHTERFFHFFNILKDNAWKWENVIVTDMKDVIFQSNPSEFLEGCLYCEGEEIIASSECIRYKDEEWGNLNLMQTFGPYFHEYFKHNIIYNVGVIAGKAEWIKDLCLNIFMMATNRPQPICDQAVYNALLGTRIYQDNIYFSDMDSGWACHLGTVMDPVKIKKFEPFLTELSPKIDEDGFVVTAYGSPICVVHQYDRIPELKKIVEERYG